MVYMYHVLPKVSSTKCRKVSDNKLCVALHQYLFLEFTPYNMPLVCPSSVYFSSGVDNGRPGCLDVREARETLRISHFSGAVER